MRKLLILFLCLFMGCVAIAQSSELTIEQHLEDYDLAVKYIEDNYSGFPNKVVESTRADYEAMKTSLRNQVAKDGRYGFHAVTEYTGWFNDFHLRLGANFLDSDGQWKRYNTDQFIKREKVDYNGLMDLYQPSAVACKVTDKTFLIRLPSCEGNPDLKWVKNSIKEFKKSHCENLVIDIRGNSGGSDRIWEPYLKLLYDHETQLPGVEFRNTPQNIASMKSEGGFHKSLISRMSSSPGIEYVGSPLIQIQLKNKDKAVRQAAIIIDNVVASAGEQMVRMIKACSSRTRIFGKDNTSGCLDYSNLSVLELPNSHFYLLCPKSRICGLPETSIDAAGISPDVRIDLPLPARLTDNIDEWVIWVAEQLEK